jgi:hypothetical protein
MNFLSNPSATNTVKKIFLVTVFGVAMAFVESAVVVYLREIFYPEGFHFPLQALTDKLIGIEVLREIATMFMLLSVCILTGEKLWERFAYFLFCFGIWDIFYYIWLKLLIDWPSTLFEWDILFLIPLPWIGPVIAPVSISLMMIVFGIIMIWLFHRKFDFKPLFISKVLGVAGTGLVLFSFLRDTDATLHHKLPQPYLYELLLAGEFLYVVAFILSYRKIPRQKYVKP